MVSEQTVVVLIYGGYLAAAIGSALTYRRELRQMPPQLVPLGVLVFAPVVMRISDSMLTADRHPADRTPHFTREEVDLVTAFVHAETERERRRLLEQMPRDLTQKAIWVNQVVRRAAGDDRQNRRKNEPPEPYEIDGIDLDPTGLRSVRDDR